MERRNIIERVAAGLRQVKEEPDFLVWLDCMVDNYTWDEPSMMGIPVLHFSGHIVHRPYSDEDCPVLPCYKKEVDEMEIWAFVRGYIDNQEVTK